MSVDGTLARRLLLIITVIASFYGSMIIGIPVPPIHLFIVPNVAARPATDSVLVNPLKGSGVRWLHFEVFSAVQV